MKRPTCVGSESWGANQSLRPVPAPAHWPINEVLNQAFLPMEVSIGAFEAKAQRSRLLRAVVQGEWFTITVRAKPVADLLPPPG